MDELYTVNQLAEHLNVTPRTLRFYEQEGLLSPNRVGNNRVYTMDDRQRMVLILRCKRLGYSLSEIREYLELHNLGQDPGGPPKDFVARLRERMAILERQRADIDATMADLRELEARVCTDPPKSASHRA